MVLYENGSAKNVFHFFEEIARIPRGSGNTGKIADYLVSFAGERGLRHYRDEKDNVVIWKPAAKGYEKNPAVILQGHTDMVAEKTPGLPKDMTREGVDIYTDGDFLRAHGTTLGGDDGIFVAYALALLDSKDALHPEIEAVFTSDEEVGLLGATALDTSVLHGRTMINIDSDDEGVFTVGCAGGMRSDLSLPIERSGCILQAYEIVISGLAGGHSGAEIDKGRANATKLMGEFLSSLSGIRICDLHGGKADNAIPRECVAVVCAAADPSGAAADFLAAMRERYGDIEPDMKITVRETAASLPLTAESTGRAIKLITSVPDGVIAMSTDIPGLVQTSLNLGITETRRDRLSLSHSVRSSKEDEKLALAKRLREIVTSLGGSYSQRGEYPAWEYRKTSRIRDCMVKVYREMYGKDPKVVAIHAGLECGIFSGKLPGLDCISFGPDNFDIHTTEEHLSISSSVRCWEFLLEVLRRL